MMSEDQEFPTLAILSATSGTLFCQHISQLYDVLDHVLGLGLMTHELPEASRVVSPYILKRHPQLREASERARALVPEKDEHFETNMTFLCNVLETIYGKTLPLSFVQEARAEWDAKTDLSQFFSEVRFGR